MGDPHLAFAAGKDVVKKHAQWRHFEMKEKVDSQSRKDPGAPFVIGGGGSALPAFGCWRAQPRVGPGIYGGVRTSACGPWADGEGEGIGRVGAVKSLFFCAKGRPH